MSRPTTDSQDEIDYEEDVEDEKKQDDALESENTSKQRENDETTATTLRKGGTGGVSEGGILKNVLYLTRFPHTAIETSIRQHCEQFGEITYLAIRGNNCFVEFKNIEDAATCKQALHHQPGRSRGQLSLHAFFMRE